MARDPVPAVIVCANRASTHGPGLRLQVEMLVEAGCRVVGVGHGLPQSANASAYDCAYDLPLPQAGSPRSLVQAFRAFRSICRYERPDVAWFHTSLAAAVGRAAVLSLPKVERPLIAYMAYGFYWEPMRRSVAGPFNRSVEWLLSMATDHLQTVNREDYERARRLPRRSAANTELTRGIGVDLRAAQASTRQRDEVRRRLQIEPSDRAVFVLGQLDERHRVGDALRAVADLRDGTRLFVVGDGPNRRELESTADGLPGPRARFLGPRRDRLDMLAAADAVIHPSVREGLPAVIVEAQAMNIPVVGARVRGTSDLLTNGAGVLCRVGDTRSLTRGLRSVLGDGARREEVLAAGRARAEQHAGGLATVAARSINHLLLGTNLAPYGDELESSRS